MPINDPRDIPGLLAWYSADYEATIYADNATVTVLHDLSGNGNDSLSITGAPLMQYGLGSGGGPAFEFLGTGAAFNLPNIYSGQTQGEQRTNQISFGIQGSGVRWWSQFGSHNIGNLWPWNDGNLYDDYGSNARYGPISVAAKPLLANWRRIRQWSKTNDWETQADETTLSHQGTNTVAWLATPKFGCGSAGSLADIACGYSLHYDHKLTAGENTDLLAWQIANPSGGFPINLPPDPPTGLVITDTSATSLAFAWDAMPTATGYKVRIDGGPEIDVGNVLAWEFTGLDPETTYTLEVLAYNDNGDSDWSSIEGTTDAVPDAATVTLAECLDGVCGYVSVTFHVTSADPVTVTPGAVGGGVTTLGSPVEHPGGGTTVDVTLGMNPTPGFPECWQPFLTFTLYDDAAPISWYAEVTAPPVLTSEQQIARERRRLDGVVVVDGPKELDRVTVNGTVFSTVEWTMVATDPYLYRDPRHIWNGAPGAAPVFLDGGVTLLASNPAFAEISCPAPSSSLVTCADNPACPPLLAPPAAPTVPGCDPDVATWDRQWVEVPASVAGTGETVLTASLTNETGFGQTVRIRLYHASDFTTECSFTQELWVDYIPPGQTVTLSEGGQVYVTCDDGSTVNATRNVRGTYRGPYEPLILGCAEDWVAVFDVAGADTTAEWDVSLVVRTG